MKPNTEKKNVMYSLAFKTNCLEIARGNARK